MAFIFLVLGLIIGSFLNVVVYRLKGAETVLGRSHCPKCKKQIRWRDNVPVVSFLLLSARCRDCGEKISWQYPLVELGTGAVFALIGSYFFALGDTSTWIQTAFLLAVSSLLLVIFVYDLKYMEIPMLVLWAGVALAVAYVLYADWKSFAPALGIMDFKTFSALAGASALFLFFFALSWFSRETWMGEGDAYLGLLVGLIVGWPNVIFVLMLSSVIGAMVSIALVASRKKTMKSQVPFAPFLVLGTLLVLVLPKMFPALGAFMYFN